MRFRTLALVLLLCVCPAAVHGQAFDPDIRSALEGVRNRGNSLAVRSMLAQEGGQRSQRALDALADSLVVIAVSASSDDYPDGRNVAMAARLALAYSGKAERSRPYRGAFEALVRIFEDSDPNGTKYATLSLIAELPDHGRSVEYLSRIAVSENMMDAYTAVGLLGDRTGELGLNRLRVLFTGDEVVDTTAKERLGWIASREGWVREEVTPAA
jgi:hypothetical protein